MRRSVFAAPVLALSLSAGGAWAMSVVDTIIDGLRAQGYSQIDISRTLLGRTRIEATSSAFEREIIIDPRTGEILRDYWEVRLDASGQPVATNPTPPSLVGAGSSGSGSPPDDDLDDDSSGSGSGSNSGSGSSGSGNSGSGHSGSGGSGGNDDDADDD